MNETKVDRVGRFDYVEPMNLNLDLPDNAITHKPEDYCISVNLTVEVPSRFYKENNDTILVASSDNGSISFFGGSDFGGPISGESKDMSRGYLSTSWTDISVNNVGKGNRECLGIESINVAYSPNFFPMVTIRFVDVRGASLFMPQEESYRNWVNDNSYDPKRPFDGNSFFKSLFSMPSPIFKLTIKGFYGKQVTYKLLMSKFDSEFDSETGNFIANVQFAGYMYGVYTELPMSFIALSPYLDGLKYWEKKHFTLDNGIEIPTIPNLIKKIGEAVKQAPQESLQSEKGREFTETQALLTKLKEVKNNFPFKGFVKSEGEFGSESKRGIKFAEENYSNGEKKFTDVDELETRSRILAGQSKQVYYKIDPANNTSLFSSNRVTYSSDGTGFDSKLREFKKGSIENYKEQLKELVDKHGKEYQRYVDDFDTLLDVLNYQKNIYENGELTQVANPVMCVLCKGGSGEKQVRGVDLVNKDKEKKTYGVSYLGFKIGEGASCRDCKPEDIEAICKKIEGEGFTYSSTVFVSRIITNILVWAEDEIKQLEKRYEKQEGEVREQQSEIAERLIGFPLTIKNVYDIIFAHIDTFMFRFYGHLNNITNDTVRKNLINGNFYSLLDVPDSCKDKEIPPFPTFVSKTEKDGEKITWPCVILNDDIEETKFVYEIINAALQLGNDIEATLKELENKSNANANAVNYPTGSDKRIPVTIFDLLYDGNVNPYVAVYERYKANPSIDVKKEIWFTFIMRCAYFGEIFAKYRTLYTTDSKSYGDLKKAQEDIFNGAHEYFAAAEACNIKKAFGNNLDMPVIVDMVNETANSAFKSELNSYITGTETTPFKNTSENWGKWNINFAKDFEVDDKHFAIPIKNLQLDSTRTDIGDKTCVDKNDEYVVFRKDGKNTTETLNGKILNEKSIQVIERDDFFSKWVNLIKGDAVFQESTATENSQIGTFLDDFLNNYLGKYMYGGADEKAGDLVDNPYRIGDNEKIFVEKVNGEKFSYLDIAKLSTQESGVYCLQYSKNKQKPKNYTSFINGLPCIDPVNVITTGTTSKITAHFPYNDNVEFKEFLNSAATPYDKAYLFLFSLPIKKSYFSDGYLGLKSVGSNLQKVAKSCLLREGAFYYWQENWQTIKSHFYGNYGATMTENSIPIIKTEEKNPAPTLFMKNDKEQEYMTLELKDIPLNRKKFLIDYFKRWVETDFKTDIANIQMNVSGLTDSEMQRVMNLYLHGVVYVDYSQPLVRNLFRNSFEKSKIEAENVKFFTSIYDKFRNYFSILYPQDTLTTKPDAINLQDVEKGIKSSIDLKLSVYLTLQSLYNKFIAGNKHDRWKYQGKESDFNNFIYMDSFYNLIGQKLIFNSTRIQHMLSDVTDSVNALANSDTNMYKGSVYEFFSTICQENGLNLLALPVKPFVTEDSNGGVAWHLFDNIPYSQMESGESSCFISMYTYRPSEHLDNPDGNGLYVYKNDGFDINLNGEKDLPIPLQDFGEYDNAPRIPAFAVSYGKQNQSIFKKITVSTANPQITEPSIAMTLNIAAKGDSNPRDSVFFGQDIYSVYSNYSYTCDVEMMGCAPIMPLMYFQLNNIPMFKGAYMIIHVEHNVVAGNMTTRFKGVRVNKAAIPFVKVPYVYTDDLGNRILNDNGEYTEGAPLGDGGTNGSTYSGPVTNIKGTETSDIITTKNPLVCLTPAHGPKTEKKLENAWSTKVVERIIDKIDKYNLGKDEKSMIHFNYCNQNGRNTGKGYSTVETRNLISKYGSDKVISLVPHWNGAAGNYFVAMTGGGDHNKPQRPDSMKLCQFIVDEAKKVKESMNFHGMFNGTVKTLPLGPNNTDGAAQLDCACVLTENWFADYNSKDSNKWSQTPPDNTTGRYWLESPQGVDTIATLHFNAIIKYIEDLNKA